MFRCMAATAPRMAPGLVAVAGFRQRWWPSVVRAGRCSAPRPRRRVDRRSRRAQRGGRGVIARASSSRRDWCCAVPRRGSSLTAMRIGIIGLGRRRGALGNARTAHGRPAVRVHRYVASALPANAYLVEARSAAREVNPSRVSRRKSNDGSRLLDGVGTGMVIWAARAARVAAKVQRAALKEGTRDRCFNTGCHRPDGS
jgi:hypothetical protein